MTSVFLNPFIESHLFTDFYIDMHFVYSFYFVCFLTVDGSSDDIDIVVRDLFADPTFVHKHNLASPSSLNFTRVLVQMVHIFYTYLQVNTPRL